MFDKHVLEAMLACFGMFRFGPTWEEALCMFDKHVLEAMLAGLRSKSDAGMFWHVSLWPVHVDQNVLEAMLHVCIPKAMLACFGMFRFGPTWEEALCMVDQNSLEAMLACSGMFRFGPTWEEALCMFDKNVLESMLARLRSESDAGMFWHVSLWPNGGKRPCACLIKTV